jgi:hypothetical protein
MCVCVCEGYETFKNIIWTRGSHAPPRVHDHVLLRLQQALVKKKKTDKCIKKKLLGQRIPKLKKKNYG